MSGNKGVHFRPVILAGGSGTRFWPRSRRARAKQVLALDGERSMIQRTVERLFPLADHADFLVITNSLLSTTIGQQLNWLKDQQILREPCAKNTAPAAGLAAFLIEREDPEAVIGIFPADHVIGDEQGFVDVLRRGIALAAAGENIVVLGIAPTGPETGYGYIETGTAHGDGVMRVHRFTEKPNLQRAEAFVAAGNYHWNSGIFLWSARTLANAVREHLPETAPYLERIAAASGTAEFTRVFEELYPKCENISVDVAVLEPRSAKGEHRSKLFCIPAAFGWNDLGSWKALFEHALLSGESVDRHGNVLETAGGHSLHSAGNYVYSPKKFAALVGVHDLVVVETEDAILVTTRAHSQDVGKVVKELAASGREELT